MRKIPSKASSTASSATFLSRTETHESAYIQSDVDPEKLIPLRTVGKGCFGKVVLARHGDELVAVKVAGKHQIVSLSDMNKAVVELKIMKTVCTRNPFLCYSRGGFQTDDAFILVMNFAAGGDLFFHLQNFGPLNEGKTKLLMMQVVLGLQHLHLHGIVHRDLKPENILLTNQGRAQITDFGLSKYLPRINSSGESDARNSFSSFATELGRNESPMKSNWGCMPNFYRKPRKSLATQIEVIWGTTQTRCGTPTYRSPDAVAGREYSLEADYWALGCMLYETLTGLPAFTGKTLKDLNQAILTANPRYRNLRRPLPSKARILIQELLVKDRTQRLGYGAHGARQLKSHVFFARDPALKEHYTWEQVYNLETPSVVFLSDEGCVREPERLRFIAEEFINMDIVESVPMSPKKHIEGYERIANDLLLEKFITPTIPPPAPLSPSSSPKSQSKVL